MYLIILEAEEKSPRTICRYGMIIRHFIRFLAANNFSQSISEISSLEIGLFLKKARDRGLSPDTLYGYHKDLRIFFNWLIREEMLEKNPVSKIAAPRRSKSIITPLSHDDINNVLLLCSGKRFVDIRNRAIIMLFLDTGLRLSELANIKLDDIDIQTGLIKVMGKGRKMRIVRMGKTTQRAVLRYMMARESSSDNLWLTERYTDITAHGVQVMVKKLLKEAEVSSSKKGVHILRHTAAILFLRNNGEITALQSMLGHSDIQTTMIYLSSLGSEDMIKEHSKASPMDNMYK